MNSTPVRPDLHHAVDGVAAAAADTDHLDLGAPARRVIERQPQLLCLALIGLLHVASC